MTGFFHFDEDDHLQDRYISSDIDPVALSCWAHERKIILIESLYTNANERPIISNNQRKLATEIREYYGNKFLLMQLKGETLTKFRHELLGFLAQEDKNRISHNIIGMIATLPRLYNEDKLLDKLRKEYNNSPWHASEPHGRKITTTLTFIDSHTKKAFRHHGQSRIEWLCYWCHDENDRLYMLEMDLNCPFRNFWQKTIEHPFPVKGSPIKHEAKDGLQYYTLTDWEIL
jgi:hypothetical protein